MKKVWHCTHAITLVIPVDNVMSNNLWVKIQFINSGRTVVKTLELFVNER